MKAILVEHRLAIPEELQPKVKAMIAVMSLGITHKITQAGFSVQAVAVRDLMTTLYKEIAVQVGAVYADYPVWDVSDSGDELIGYRYEFHEEGENG